MKPHNFLEEEIHNISSIITLMASNKVTILENQSTNTVVASFPQDVLGRAIMKSMLISSQGLVETGGEV